MMFEGVYRSRYVVSQVVGQLVYCKPLWETLHLIQVQVGNYNDPVVQM